ncbi:MAG TPA: hypothetical protein VGY48_07880 [Vicinamibacterales bacterium]|jgi:hypothetical protein|nr:hypothetical protein [Vicinamibacterales bacterium]
MRVPAQSRALYAAGLTAAALIAGACEASKSSNPLAPTVAGPIPGVNITAPKALDPAAGQKIAVDQQPITLLVQNATTNGVRPLTYAFEVATDANFSNTVFSRQSVAPGDGGRTSLRLPDALATGRTYYWRAVAADGANTGSFTPPTNFDVFSPIVIDAPGPLAPAENSTTDSVRPKFTIADATHSGPVGAISYLIEIADSGAFTNKIATWTAAEQPGQTVLVLGSDLAYGGVYYWHVRAFDPTTSGPWSRVFAFATPAQPPVVTPPPTGPAPGDALNLGLATIQNSPKDVASWPATATITSLDLGNNGAHIEFTKKNGPGSWPDVPFLTPGQDLQYTLWIVLNINGRLYASGCVEFWRGLDRNGGAPAQYAQNWYYDPGRWGPMAGYQPANGESVGFLVTAGDARNNGAAVVKERSNAVVVPFPSGGGVFTFSLSKSR